MVITMASYALQTPPRLGWRTQSRLGQFFLSTFTSLHIERTVIDVPQIVLTGPHVGSNNRLRLIFTNKIQNANIKSCLMNTPGTAGGPGGSDQTLAVKSKTIARKSFFSS